MANTYTQIYIQIVFAIQRKTKSYKKWMERWIIQIHHWNC